MNTGRKRKKTCVERRGSVKELGGSSASQPANRTLRFPVSLPCLYPTGTHMPVGHVRRVLHANSCVVRSDESETLSSQLALSTFTVVLLLHMYLTAGVTANFMMSFYVQSTQYKLMRYDAKCYFILIFIIDCILHYWQHCCLSE